MPQATVKINRAVEFITAAYALAVREKGMENTAPEPLRVDPEAEAWLDRVSETISPFDKFGMQLIFSAVTSKIFLYDLVFRHGISDAQSLVDLLRSFDTGTFADGFMEVLGLQETAAPEAGVEQIRKALENDRGPQVESFASEARQLVKLLSKPDRFFHTMTQSLESFNASFFSESMDHIESILQKKAAEHEKLLRKDPENFIEHLTLGSFKALLAQREEIVFIPVYIHQKCIDMGNAGETYVVYGLAHEARLYGEDVRKKTDAFIKALGDPSRLTILRLISGRKWYGKELAERLDLSTATVSYHLEKLMAAGLIQIESSKQRRLLYSVNTKGIQDLISSLETEFLAESPTTESSTR